MDAERIASRMADPRPRDPRDYLLAFYPDVPIPPLERRAPDAAPLPARINHGVWIVSCSCRADGEPAPGMIVWLTVPWAWCIRCRNRAAGGAWRPIDLPSSDDREALEAVLERRAEIFDRNWEPTETVGQLIVQNREHGDPVPEGMS